MEPISSDSAIYKPVAIKTYNQHMGGVDRVDQQLHNIQVLRKSNKSYRKLSFYLSIQMILNAHKPTFSNVKRSKCDRLQ